MARVPTSFYLSILAGVFVLFHHFASCETGDAASNKITGAAGRFYTLFLDTALTIQHGGTSRIETALCGPAVDSILSRDTAEYLRMRYCRAHVQGASNDRHPHEGYGGSNFAFVHYRHPASSARRLARQSPFSLDRSDMWSRSSEAIATVGLFLLRACASWWWFAAPLKVIGVFLAAYIVLSALGSLFFGASMALQFVSEVYAVVAGDFLRCIEWEAHRRVSDIAVFTMERAYGALKHALERG